MAQYSLTELPGTAVALNDAGQVAGTIVEPTYFVATFLYEAGVVDTFGIGRGTNAAAINASGQVVGSFDYGGDNPTHGNFLWDGSGPPELFGGLQATAINDSAEIVGIDNVGGGLRPLGPNHAFLIKNGAFTDFDPPGATASTAADINNAGQIVGSYTDASGQSYGFLYDSGTFTTIAPSEAGWSQATHIDASGVVIGEYALSGETPPNQEYAFIYDQGGITRLEQTGTSLSVATAINAAGEVVGYYDTGSQSHAFIYDGGQTFTIDPLGATSASAVGVNALGEVVGNYTDAAGSHVFVYDDGTFSTIDEPGAGSISAVAINAGGQVIGNYADDTGRHGFIADPSSNQKTWVGIVSNDASDPANWSPSGAPQPGDTLLLPSGSPIDIRGDDLQGNPLVLAAEQGNTETATLNLSHQAEVTLENGAATLGTGNAVVNVAGCDTLDLISRPPNEPPSPGALAVTVNLASHARLDGSFVIGSGSGLTVTGDQHAKFINSGTDTVAGCQASIDVGVFGSGSFVVQVGGYTPDSLAAGDLNFGGFVSKGQVIDVSGTLLDIGPRTSEVSIDHPDEFHGTLDLHDYSLADLAGLARADAWSYKNDMLTILSGCGQAADRIHVTIDAASTGGVNGLSVSLNSDGHILISPGTEFHGLLG